MRYNIYMYRVKNLTVNATPQELTIPDAVDSHYTIIITNTSSNKHLLIGGADVSTTHYGIRLEHDQPPIILENMSWKDRFYGISEDPNATVNCAVMVIERN
jgi:hypothetical protein